LSGWYWCILFYFCKSMANIGAFVAADKDIIDIWNTIYVLKCLPKLYQWFKLLVR
jgi:hypothetical protein